MARDSDGMVEIEVEVKWPSGRVETEKSKGRSLRHALFKARERHRGEARVDPVESWIL